MRNKKSRPKNLDLQTIRFPITAIASILHRVAGVVTFVFVALLLCLLAQSLQSPAGFIHAKSIVDSFFVKFVFWLFLTGFLYHLVGGIRHLIMDFGYFEELEPANKSAKVAFVVTVVLALIAGVCIW